MKKGVVLSISPLLKQGEEATLYNKITEQILREESKKLRAIPKQADNWNALAYQVVGAKHIGNG